MNNSLKGKRLLVLGGTQISCEIIRKAKSMGVHVIVTDYNDVIDSPGKQIADESYMVSATDVDGVVNLIREAKIDGVIVGFNDMLLPYYAEICEKAKLPCYGTKEQFEIFTNKDAYKSLCRKYHVPTVEEYHLSLDKFYEDIDKIKFPVLIKPSDNSGARGIFICKDKQELLEKYEEALKYSSSKTILIEQYLTGDEITVFFVFDNGEYYITGIGNRHVKYFQNGLIPLPVGYTYPATITDKYINDVFPYVKNMLKSIGLKNGMMFMQCKVENGIPVVYDIGYRLTASLEYKMFELDSGFNPLEMIIRFSLTGSMSSCDLSKIINPYMNGYGYNISFLAEKGIIKYINGVEETKHIEGVADVVIAHYPGEEITENMSGLLSQITVRVVGVAHDYNDLCNKISQIQNLIEVIDINGNNLVYRHLYESDFSGLLKKWGW